MKDFASLSLLRTYCKDRLLITAGGLALLWVALASMMVYFFPRLAPALIGEGQLQENVSAGFYLLASATGWAAIAWHGRSGIRFIGLPLLALLGALSEVSFGEEYLDLQMPVVGGHKLDAVHDMFEIVDEMIAGVLGRWPALALELTVLCVLVGLGCVRGWWGAALRGALAIRAYRFILLACVLIGPAIVVDMFIATTWASVVEESLECAGGFVLCWGAMVIFPTDVLSGPGTAWSPESNLARADDAILASEATRTHHQQGVR